MEKRLIQGHLIVCFIIHYEQQVTIYYVREYAGFENKLYFILVSLLVFFSVFSFIY